MPFVVTRHVGHAAAGKEGKYPDGDEDGDAGETEEKGG